MTPELYSVSGVTYEDTTLYQRVRKEADQKFPKESYTKNLWVLREYKRRGGKVRYTGRKPTKDTIRTQVQASAGEQSIVIDFEAAAVARALPAEVIALRSSTDPEMASLSEELETYAYCLEDEGFMADFIETAADKKANVRLNKPFRTSNGPKKFAVYVKNDKGTVVLVRFGDPDMEIKRDDPERRRNFRARHNCDNPGPRWKARYWSCRMWSSKPVSSMAETMSEADFAEAFPGAEEAVD